MNLLEISFDELKTYNLLKLKDIEKSLKISLLDLALKSHQDNLKKDLKNKKLFRKKIAQVLTLKKEKGMHETK